MADGESAGRLRPVAEGEPPQKQLKLSVEGDNLPSPLSPAQHSQENAAASAAGDAEDIDVKRNEDTGRQNPSTVPIPSISNGCLENSSLEIRGSPDSNIAGSETRVGHHGDASISGDNERDALQASGAPMPRDARHVPKVVLVTDLGPGATAQERSKTSLCSYFRKSGCRHGAACRYAHGEEELRPRPDGSWDPTSERAKRMLEKAAAGVSKPAVDASAVQASVAAGREMVETNENPLSKCIVNVPRGWSVDHLKKFLTENGISYTTTKKRKGMNVAFVGFKTAEDVGQAFEVLNGKVVGKKELVVTESRSRSLAAVGPSSHGESHLDNGAAEEVAAAGPDGDGCDDSGVGDSELMAISREGTTGEVRNVCNAVTPLAHMSYEDQLTLKRDNITQVLKRLVRNTRKGIPNGGLLPEWILGARDKGGLPCVLEGVLASPHVDGYRNKCEFTIGCSEPGEKVVGFQVGSFREGILAVAEPGDCRNVSGIGRFYAALFQKFVRGSDLPVWNKMTNSGFWRLLTVREGRAACNEKADDRTTFDTAEVMLVVQVCPTGIERARLDVEYKRMAEFLANGAYTSSPPMPLTALLVQDHAGISNVFSPDAPLHPLVIADPIHNEAKQNEFIHEHLNNLRFQISPTAFFQVNTLAAERLYNVVGDWAGLTPETLLFDVCCGTGTIGLTLAHRVGMVVGIEMNASAVEDAQKNAQINDIQNCRFVCGKAEEVMDGLLKEYLAAEVTSTTKCGVEEPRGLGANEEDKSLEMSRGSNLLANSAADDVRGDALPGVAHSELHERDRNGLTLSESPLEQLASGRKFTHLVAIVDPPRVGLHPTVSEEHFESLGRILSFA